ncbi:MAG: type I restriction enzyme HsdR N-terminal domain-containing protein [Polyangiales bacterium]
MNKKGMNETEICQNFVSPAIEKSGWDKLTQVRREYFFTDGQVIVKGKVASRGKRKRADYLLFYQSHLPLAIVEAKDNHHELGAGMPQALNYAEILDIPFVFATNGDGFLFHDRTGLSSPVERTLSLDEFPSPAELYERFRQWKGWSEAGEKVSRQPFFEDPSGKEPRYYQRVAIQRTVEAVAGAEAKVPPFLPRRGLDGVPHRTEHGWSKAIRLAD